MPAKHPIVETETAPETHEAMVARLLALKLGKSDEALVVRLMQSGMPEWSALHAVIDSGLSEDDITWNQRLGRPMGFMETVHPDDETERRRAWSRMNPGA